MKLYIYDHCPYCVRARMIFGLKELPVQLCILPNHDAETPTSMIGKKMLPILQKDDGSYMAESLDIVRYVDNLDGNPVLSDNSSPELMAWITEVSGYVNRLIIPHIAEAEFAEFTSKQSRDEFIEKKEAIIGNFFENRTNKPLVQKLNLDIARLAPLLTAKNDLTYDDIQLFPILRNLGLVYNSGFNGDVFNYTYNMAKRTRINLLR